MNNGIRLVVYPVKDLAKARTLYKDLLGLEPYVEGGTLVSGSVNRK